MTQGPLRTQRNASDFLGLEIELERRAQSAPPPLRHAEFARSPHGVTFEPPPVLPVPHDPGTVAMPPQELLHPGEALRAHWPQPRAAHSWLLRPDGEEPRPPVPELAIARPAAASFHDGSAATRSLAPWLVRGLLALGGLLLCAAIGKTFLSARPAPPTEASTPMAPEGARPEARAHGLESPEDARVEDRSSARGERPSGQRPTSVPAPAATGDRGISSRVPTRADAAPAIAVYPIGPSARDLDAGAGLGRPWTPAADEPDGVATGLSPAARARVERWLLEQSRSSSPLSDLAMVTAVPTAASAARGTPETTVGTWEGATIPIEALDGSLRFLTPAVGRVRARLAAGAPREGRLTAIGQGRIWLESEGETHIIESARLHALEQLAVARTARAVPPVEGRVRVRTEGGVFFGEIVERRGRNVTIESDEGARWTLESDDVEPCGARSEPAVPDPPAPSR